MYFRDSILLKDINPFDLISNCTLSVSSLVMSVYTLLVLRVLKEVKKPVLEIFYFVRSWWAVHGLGYRTSQLQTDLDTGHWVYTRENPARPWLRRPSTPTA